jgi:transposase
MSSREERIENLPALLIVKTQAKVAEELGVHRNTIQRDFTEAKRRGLLDLSGDAAIQRAEEVANIAKEIDELKAEVRQLDPGSRRIMVQCRVLDRRIRLLELFTPKTNVNVDIKGFYMTPWFNYLRLLSYGWSDEIKEEFKIIADAFAERHRPIDVPIVVSPEGFLDNE